MANTIKVENGRLLVDVAIASEQTARPSKTGKTKIYFTTAGNVAVGDGFKLGVNLYK